MKPVLVVYGTTAGQTRKIAEFIGTALQARGVEVELVDSAAQDAALVQPVHAAAVVCGALHGHDYPPSLVRFVRENRGWLAGIPAAFVAVSLTATQGDDRSRDELRDAADAFCRKTGWTPGIIHHVAGALRGSQCGLLERAIVKRVARKHGVDASRDHEYTDWKDLTAFVEDFLEAISVQEGGH